MSTWKPPWKLPWAKSLVNINFNFIQNNFKTRIKLRLLIGMAIFLPIGIDQLLLYKSLIPISFQYITSTCSNTKLMLFVNTQTCKKNLIHNKSKEEREWCLISFQNPIWKENQQKFQKNTFCPNMNRLSNCLYV